MKKFFALMLSLLLCCTSVFALAETAETTAETTATVPTIVADKTLDPVNVLGTWTYDVDLATWFEYKGGDVDGKVAYQWQFNADGTFTQKYADPAKVSTVVTNLMTKILTAEIAAEGVTISTVATAEGFASVDAFVQSILKKEKLNTLGNEETKGTYKVEGNVLTMYFTDAEGKQVEAVDTVAIADGVMTLVGASNETITLTYVETAEAPAA